MSYNSVYYWENFIDKGTATIAKPDSYIVNFYAINKKERLHHCKWFFFDTHQELLNFVKYVALPSLYYSRMYGTMAGLPFFTADTYQGVLEIIDENPIKDETLLYYMKRDFDEIDQIEKDFTLIMLKILCYDITFHVNFWGDIFSGITVYENFQDLKGRLAFSFKKDKVNAELWEDQLDMSQSEIIEMFTNIENNPFMLKQISGILNRTILML